MKPKYKQLVRQQLDATLAKFAEIKNVQPPPKGWIRAVREALGMSGTQLARRLQVSQPRVFRLEQDEPAGALTLRTMLLEAQSLSVEEQQAALVGAVEELMREMPRDFWEVQP